VLILYLRKYNIDMRMLAFTNVVESSRFGALISKNFVLLSLVCYPFFSIFFYKGYFLTILLGLFIVVAVDLYLRNGRVFFDKQALPVYLFFCLPLVSTFWSIFPDITLWKGSLVLVNIGVFYLASRASLYKKNELISAVVIIVPSTVFFAFMFIFFVYGSVRPLSVSMADEVGAFSNLGGALVVLCVPYLFVLYKVKKSKVMVLLSLLACVLVVILSESRGAALMLLVSMVLSYYFLTGSYKYKHVKFLAVSTVILFIGIFVYFGGLDVIDSPIVKRFGESQVLHVLYDNNLVPVKSEPDYVRAVMYVEGLDLVLENTLHGIGYGSMGYSLEEKYGFLVVSHNLFITVIGEMGIVGAVIFTWLMVVVFFRLRRMQKYSRLGSCDHLIASATIISIIVFFIHAQFRPQLLNPMLPVLLAMAFLKVPKLYTTEITTCEYSNSNIDRNKATL